MIQHYPTAHHRAFAFTEVRDENGYCLKGMIYNIGDDGAFILTDTKVPFSGSVDIRMPYIKANNTAIWLSGRVTHRNHVGFGLTFARLDDDARRVIRTLSAIRR